MSGLLSLVKAAIASIARRSPMSPRDRSAHSRTSSSLSCKVAIRPSKARGSPMSPSDRAAHSRTSASVSDRLCAKPSTASVLPISPNARADHSLTSSLSVGQSTKQCGTADGSRCHRENVQTIHAHANWDPEETRSKRLRHRGFCTVQGLVLPQPV